MNTQDWGRTHYRDALRRQTDLVAAVRAGDSPSTLVFTEHHPVYTIGARKGAAQHLIWGSQQLADNGIDVVSTNRGGDITYHGPGQVVGYPVIDLHARRDLHAYLRDLEEVLIRAVAHFGINAARRPGMTGIWVQNRKIAAIGVAVKGWISYHGFALNVHPQMSHFAGIVPCGITDGSVSSLAQECDETPAMDGVKSVLRLEFWNLFADR